MIDLALQLGTLPDVLAASMTEIQFIELQHYAARKMLPQRRIELYLARVCLQIARLGSDTQSTLEDFLFQPVDNEEATGDELAEAKAFFDFNPSSE